MSMLHSLTLACAGVVAFGCSSAERREPQGSRENDLAEIAAVRDQTQTALTSDDVPGIMAALGEDHVTMPPGEAALTDSAALAAWHEARVERFSLESDFTTDEIRWYGDVAIERWSATNRLVPRGEGQEVSDELEGLWVWERQEDGSWKLLWSIWNSKGGAAQGEDEMTTRRSSMDPETMKETARRWIRGIWDEHDVEFLDELATPGYTYTVSNDAPMGRDAFAAFVRSIGTAFPQLRNTIEEQVVDGDLVITRGVTVATHGGPLGELQATGRTVSVPFVMFTRFRDGRIASDWELFDQAGMLAQLTANDD